MILFPARVYFSLGRKDKFYVWQRFLFHDALTYQYWIKNTRRVRKLLKCQPV